MGSHQVTHVEGSLITIDEVELALERWRLLNQALGRFALTKPVDALTQLQEQMLKTGADSIDKSQISARARAALRGPGITRQV